MILYKKAGQLIDHIGQQRSKGLKIGLVPTMGALHPGHVSLIEAAKKETELAICSIFVNPTQFNDPRDFQKYPVTIEKDIYLLEKKGTDILFLPAVEEMYPDGTAQLEHYDLGYLETILEGRFRPGHFQGVCQVMYRLLRITEPDHLFMGQKDYQQCMVIKRLLQLMDLGTVLHASPTQREADGLAMSSRNMRLSETARKKATAIYEALSYLKKNLHPGNLSDIIAKARAMLVKNDFKVDYIEIANADTLEPVNEWDGTQKLVALVAAFQEDVRLIDNMILTDQPN
jgi:pantoate--beta-alanine ligase